MKQGWYRIRAAAKAAPELDIYGEVGAFGIRAADFIRDLKALGPVERLTLSINSIGGEVFDGLAIHNALKRHPARITVRIDGLAASIASVVAMAGDEVVMPENAMMMIHDAAGIRIGTAEDMRDLADLLDKTTASMVAAYRAKTGLPDEELVAMMAAETWLTAAEAQAKGFCDRIERPVRMAASAAPLLTRFRNVPAALTYPQEVADLCALAGLPGMAGELVAAARPIAEVRNLLLDAKAAADAERPTVTHHPGSIALPSVATIDAASIYARRAEAMGQRRREDGDDRCS